MINLFQTLCVCGGGGGGGRGRGEWEGDSLISNCIKNLANKYFHFGQFLNTVLCGVVGSPTGGLGFESH